MEKIGIHFIIAKQSQSLSQTQLYVRQCKKLMIYYLNSIQDSLKIKVPCFFYTLEENDWDNVQIKKYLNLNMQILLNQYCVDWIIVIYIGQINSISIASQQIHPAYQKIYEDYGKHKTCYFSLPNTEDSLLQAELVEILMKYHQSYKFKTLLLIDGVKKIEQLDLNDPFWSQLEIIGFVTKQTKINENKMINLLLQVIVKYLLKVDHKIQKYEQMIKKRSKKLLKNMKQLCCQLNQEMKLYEESNYLIESDYSDEEVQSIQSSSQSQKQEDILNIICNDRSQKLISKAFPLHSL